MNKIFKLVLLLALLALGYWLWTKLFPDPQQVIRNRLNQAAHLVSFGPGEGNISRVAKVQKLGRLLAENIEISMDAPGWDVPRLTSREEVMQTAMAAKRFANGLKAELLDMNIDLDNTGQSAVVDVTLRAKIGGESDLLIQELKFTLKKINDDWLITRVETVKTLKP